jgi:predicted proteasome-type protease
MCKTSVTIYFYYVNICKYEHENNMTRFWCKIVLKTNVEQIEGNEGSYFYLYPFGNLIQGSLQRDFYVCIE